MDFRVIIPVRLESARLPEKPLLDIGGKPMIQHVYERAVESGAGSVVIATDSDKIKKAVEKFGAQVCMTSPDHQSGTERISEAATALGYDDDEIIVNVQGDEPLIPSQVIHQLAHDFGTHDNAKMATISQAINKPEELMSPDVVKVVMNQRGYAMYFSRAPIPWDREGFPLKSDQALKENTYYRHVGIYAYRVKFLNEYLEWEPSPLETLTGLEQLRVLWHGGRIHVAIAKTQVPMDVNTQEDLDRAREALKGAKA